MHLARASASASEARHSISLRRVSCPGLVHDRESAQDSRPYSHRSGQGERYRTAAGFPSMPQARPGPAGILMAAAPPAAIHRSPCPGIAAGWPVLIIAAGGSFTGTGCGSVREAWLAAGREMHEISGRLEDAVASRRPDRR